MSMEWFIENKSMDKHSVAATKTYGTSRMDAYSIFEDTLNLKTVTVRDRIDDGDGKYHYEVNKNETMLASFDNFVVYIAIVMITTIALSINLNSGRFDFSLGSMATLSSVLGAKITYSVLDGGNYSALNLTWMYMCLHVL